MAAVHLYIPVGAHYQKSCSRKVAGDVCEHFQGALVGIVQVFKDNEQRLHAGGIESGKK